MFESLLALGTVAWNTTIYISYCQSSDLLINSNKWVCNIQLNILCFIYRIYFFNIRIYMHRYIYIVVASKPKCLYSETLF